MARNLSRGTFTASTVPLALTVAEASLSLRRPRSPTMARPFAASKTARSLSLRPGTRLLTSTCPDIRTKRLAGSPPSSIRISPGSKIVCSTTLANSARSSSERNLKNPTSRVSLPSVPYLLVYPSQHGGLADLTDRQNERRRSEIQAPPLGELTDLVVGLRDFGVELRVRLFLLEVLVSLWRNRAVGRLDNVGGPNLPHVRLVYNVSDRCRDQNVHRQREEFVVGYGIAASVALKQPPTRHVTQDLLYGKSSFIVHSARNVRDADYLRT